jgi:hypothetical protein
VSVQIAAAVSRVAIAEGLAGRSVPEDLEGHLAACMYRPEYRAYPR